MVMQSLVTTDVATLAHAQHCTTLQTGSYNLHFNMSVVLDRLWY